MTVDHAEHPPIEVLVAHFGHDTPADGCAYCEVQPMLPELYEVWRSGNATAVEVLWSLQDGYGEPGFMPCQGYDWSGIRDSSPAAIARMHAAVHA